MAIESEDEDVSDREMDDQDPWETLRQEVEESLSSTYDKKVNKFLKEGISETIAEAKAFNALLPVYRRKLRGLYLHCLHWFEHLKHDPVHKDVMKTRHRFTEEDSMDVEEATDTAVERRKFLLNRMFQLRPIPTQNEEEKEGNDDETERFFYVYKKGCLCYCALCCDPPLTFFAIPIQTVWVHLCRSTSTWDSARI